MQDIREELHEFADRAFAQAMGKCAMKSTYPSNALKGDNPFTVNTTFNKINITLTTKNL